MDAVRTIRLATRDDQPIWNTLATHPLQSWEWGEFRKSMGIDVVRVVVEKNRTPFDVWQCSFHSIPHTPWTIGYFPKGKMPTQDMIEWFRQKGKEKRAIYIQFEPNQTVPQSNPTQLQTISNFLPSHHPLFTKHSFILDLTKSEQDLLKNMHQKTRYNIKVATKHGVVVKEDNSKEAFDAYLALSEETTNRQKYYAHNRVYQHTMWKHMKEANIAHLWTASLHNTILAAWIIFEFHTTLYYPYGSSSRQYSFSMAPNLLLWTIALWAKKNNFTSFDLWGALGENPDPHDPWYGFHKFKEGYRPNLVTYVGSYDLIINPILYKFYIIADFLRWRILHFNKNTK